MKAQMTQTPEEIQRGVEKIREERTSGLREVNCIVFDLEGYGYTLLDEGVSLEGEEPVWINFSRRPLNRAELQRVLERRRQEYPNLHVTEVKDFWCRLPERFTGRIIF